MNLSLIPDEQVQQPDQHLQTAQTYDIIISSSCYKSCDVITKYLITQP